MSDAASGILNDHSRAIYLMAPDNKFINFYRLDLSPKELCSQLIEDISYDFGHMHIGSEHLPEQHDTRFAPQPSTAK